MMFGEEWSTQNSTGLTLFLRFLELEMSLAWGRESVLGAYTDPYICTWLSVGTCGGSVWWGNKPLKLGWIIKTKPSFWSMRSYTVSFFLIISQPFFQRRRYFPQNKSFNFWVRDNFRFQKSCKSSIEFRYTHHSACPNVIILHNHEE